MVFFIPAVMLAIGLIQARSKFCAACGITHKQNVSSNLRLTIEIMDEFYQKENRNKALKIIFESLVIAIIITVLTMAGGIIIL